MSTQHFNRPDTSAPVDGEVGLPNRDKFQEVSATVPKIPISSEDVDSEINNLIDAVNELFDTAISGVLPDDSVTLLKLAHLAAGSMYIMDSAGTPTELTKGSAGEVLTMNAGATEPEWATSSAVPTGTILPFGGSTAPAGHVFADGSEISRATYGDLFAVYSTTYGVGDGSTTFNVPDLRGRTVVGMDNMGASSADRITDPQADVLGGSAGAEDHTLTVDEIPSHSHSTYSLSNTAVNGSGGNYPVDNGAGATGSTGGDGAHNNVQPSLFINYIIKT